MTRPSKTGNDRTVATSFAHVYPYSPTANRDVMPQTVRMSSDTTGRALGTAALAGRTAVAGVTFVDRFLIA